MSLTADELARLRSYVPVALLDDVAAAERALVLGSWQAAALEALRTFRASLLTSPTSFSVPEYSESWGGTIQGLEAVIDELAGLVPASAGGLGFSTGRLVRQGRSLRSGYR